MFSDGVMVLINALSKNINMKKVNLIGIVNIKSDINGF